MHWQRSVNRVTKLVCQSEEEQRVFKSLAKKIQDEDEKDNVYLIFDVLAGLKKVHEAKIKNSLKPTCTRILTIITGQD